MSDYSPLYLPGKAVTVTASAAITGGKAIKVSGDGTVATAGAGDLSIGVSGQDAAASGDKIVGFLRGTVHRLLASGTVTAGDLVVSGAAGTVATLAAVTTPTPADVTNTRAVFGIALTTATDALVEIMEL
jgi:hypothetical protein